MKACDKAWNRRKEAIERRDKADEERLELLLYLNENICPACGGDLRIKFGLLIRGFLMFFGFAGLTMTCQDCKADWS